MAYPTLSAPYGLKPVNLWGGRVFAGSTRMFPISEALGQNLFNGDAVGLAGGTVYASPYSAATSGGSSAYAAGQIIGVFVGAEYSLPGGPIYGKNRYQYWPTGTAAQDAVGYIVDDPQALFRVAVLNQPQGSANTVLNTGTTIGYMSPAFVGTNAYLITGNTGSTGTGDSAMGVTGTNPTVASSVAGNLRQTAATGAGTTCPLAIHQLVPDTAVVVSTTLTSSPSAAATFTVASTAGLQPGMQVICSSTGSSGMLAGDNAVVTAVNAGTSTITVSTRTSATNPAYTTGSVTATSGNTVTFVGYPEVIVGWNFGAHSYFISAGV